ncbi:MAG: DUF11 domain-containing protein, partial [bacterium]
MKTLRRLLRAYGWVGLAAGIGWSASESVWAADPDLPGAIANYEAIPAGSYVIPMDNTYQAIGKPFNLKAYGLVNALLHANVPVKWVIKAGKVKDAADFSAYTRMLSPTPSGTTSLRNFCAGPFIVEQAYTNLARPVISAYLNSVAVYSVMSNTAVDVRYSLTHKPKVAVFDDGNTDAIHTSILDEAGFPTSHYEVLHAEELGFIGTTSCFTIATSPHYEPKTGINSDKAQAVRDFVESGGNFLAQCAGVRTYENNANGYFHSKAGFVDKDDANTFIYPNPDMAYNQFQGLLADEGGSLQDWGLATGSVFTNSAYLCVQNASKANSYRAGVAKLAGNALGGVVFYLGGHDYSGNTLVAINGRRIYLNAIFVPSDRPGNCGITFTADLELSKTASTLLTQVGSNVTFTLVVNNKGPGNATSVSVRDILPTGLRFASASSGAYTSSNGTWNIGALSRNSSTSLLITATTTRSGVITNSAQVWTAVQGDPDSTPGNSVPTEDDQSQAVITVEEANLSLIKSVDRAFVHQGSNVTFTVAVTNRGFSNATGVTVRDFLPDGATYVSSSGGLYNSTNGIWTIGTLNAGSSTNLQITATAIALGTITNVAEVWTSNQFDPDSMPGNGIPAEDDYGTATFMSVSPGYVLIKTLVSPSGRPAAVGETVVFQIAVTNTGEVTLNTVHLRDRFSTNFVRFISATPPVNVTNFQNVVWSNVGPLAVGAGTVVTARFTAAYAGIWTNQGVATPSMTNGVSVPVNTSSVEHQIVSPKVSIAKARVFPSGRPAAVGETNLFTITVSNTGDYPLDIVPVVDTYDTGLLTFVSAVPAPADSINDGILNWTNVGPLAVGGSTVITGRFSAVRSGAGTNVVVTAPSNTNGLPVPTATNSAPHTAEDAALFVFKRVFSPSGRPVAIGEQLVFSITVTNTGAVPVFTVPLTDTFNTNLLSFVSATPPESFHAGGTLTWNNLGLLAVGGSTTVTTRFNVLTNGIGTNCVITTTSTNEVPHTNVNPRVSIAKARVFPSGRPAAVGETNVFTITVSNTGNYLLDTVPVVDTYDTGLLAFVSATPASVDNVNDGRINWANVGSLVPGASTVITGRFSAVRSGTGTNVVVTAPLNANGVPVPAATSGVPYAVVSPGVLLSKKIISPLGRPATVSREEIVFGLTVTNTGTVRLDSVPLVDTFDTNLLSVVSQTPPANSTNLPAGTLTWTNVGPLEVGGSVTVTARFTAYALGSGMNVGVTAPTTTNDVPVLPSTSIVPHTAVAVDFVVAKQLQIPAGRPALVGEEFVFTLLMANQSYVVLDTLSLIDAFDTNLLQIVSQSPPANSTNLVTGTLSWTNVGPVGISSQMVVTARFKALASGTGTNVAIWSPPMADASTSSAPHTAVSPGFSTFKTLISPTDHPAALGERVTFQITVTNTGDVALGTVVLDDTYDTAILDFHSSTPPVSVLAGNQLTWDNAGPIAVGGSTNVTVNFTAIRSTLPGVTTNTVISTVTEIHGVPVGSQTNQATVRVVLPATSLIKTLLYPSGRPAAVGETNVFTITVSNSGDYPLDTVPIEDTYDTSLLAFVGAEPPPMDTINDGILNWTNVGPLAVFGSTTITGRFSVVRSGTGTNVVVTTPSTTNGVPVPSWTNGAPHTAADASLLVTKRVVSPPGRPAAVGEQIEFSITVTNTGAVPVFTVPL